MTWGRGGVAHLGGALADGDGLAGQGVVASEQAEVRAAELAAEVHDGGAGAREVRLADVGVEAAGEEVALVRVLGVVGGDRVVDAVLLQQAGGDRAGVGDVERVDLGARPALAPPGEDRRGVGDLDAAIGADPALAFQIANDLVDPREGHPRALRELVEGRGGARELRWQKDVPRRGLRGGTSGRGRGQDWGKPDL